MTKFKHEWLIVFLLLLTEAFTDSCHADTPRRGPVRSETIEKSNHVSYDIHVGTDGMQVSYFAGVDVFFRENR